MTDLIDHQIDLPSYEDHSTDQLRELLAQELRLTADCLIRLAGIVLELQRRGEELTEFRSSLAQSVMDIAAGKLLPDTVVQFASRPDVLHILRHQPLALQHRLIAGEPIHIVAADRGQLLTRSLALVDLRPAELRLAFDETGLRSVDEQKRMILKKQSKKTRQAVDISIVPLPATNQIRIGDMRIDRETIVAALAQLSSESLVDYSTGNSIISVPDELHQKIKERAAARGCTIKHLVIEAFRAAGY